MDEDALLQELSLEVVWFDEHLVELEAVVCAGNWRGRAKAYTGEESIAAFATALQEFTDGKATSAEYIAGADNGVGLIALRFYRVNRAGHVSLASGGLGANPRPEEISRLAVEFSAEAWPLTRFAAELGELARARSGRAALPINDRDRR
jgi:hypothetical protein